MGLALFGGISGLVLGLTTKRVYESSATFIPQGSDAPSAGGAALAAQFGIRVPNTGGSWGPPVYVVLLTSRALLEPIANDSVVVPEIDSRPRKVMDFLEVPPGTPAERNDLAVRALQSTISASEMKSLGAVKVGAQTRWPNLSLAIAERLVSAVNRFNIQMRKSQAAAERQFVEMQAGEAERGLRTAEDRLQAFLQQNRDIGSSQQLAFERDRLQRDIALRQQIYTSLLQSREEAKIREVRDIPVITMIEEPVRPRLGEPRGTFQRTIVYAIAGAMLGVLLAFLSNAWKAVRRSSSEPAREFMQLVEEAQPRFVKRFRRRKEDRSP